MSTVVRAIRGATTLERDEAEHLTERVFELIEAVYQRNQLERDAVISLFLTATPDIHSKFPAAAAREWGLDDVPLMGAQEADINGALPLCIRVMLHVNTDKSLADIQHVFLRGAQTLRKDLVK